VTLRISIKKCYNLDMDKLSQVKLGDNCLRAKGNTAFKVIRSRSLLKFQ